jgi:hypothetical protein
MCQDNWWEQQFENFSRGYSFGKHFRHNRYRCDTHSWYGHNYCGHGCDRNRCCGHNGYRHSCFQQWANPDPEQRCCCECCNSLGDAGWTGHVGG